LAHTVTIGRGMVNLPKVLTDVARSSCADRQWVLHFLTVAKGLCA